MKYLPKRNLSKPLEPALGRKEFTLSCKTYSRAIGFAKRFGRFFQDLGSADHGAAALRELVRMGSTHMVQEGLEAEQADVVGRQRYERGERNGYRSGYKPGKLDSAEGRLSVALPQVRDASSFFTIGTKLFELLKGDSQRPGSSGRKRIE